MQYVSIRELRGQTNKVWDRLEQQRELVITSNGQPVGVLCPAGVNSLEQLVRDLREVRARNALTRLQVKSIEQDKHRIDQTAIQVELEGAHRQRTGATS